MTARKGFTLIEVLVVLIIVGVTAAMIIPNLIASIEQTKAQMAQNNLYAISAAQQKYFEGNNSTYCVAACGSSAPNLNTNLSLSISDTFAYSCAASGATYTCTATDGTDTLTLDPNVVSPALPISCAGPAGNCPF